MPAQNHLFTMNKEAEKLDEERSKIFHFATDRLLYLMKREWSDQKICFFMSTRLSKSNEGECENLKRGSVWVNNTTEDKRLFVSIKFSEAFTWIDLSYSVQDTTIKKHTGGPISMV